MWDRVFRGTNKNVYFAKSVNDKDGMDRVIEFNSDQEFGSVIGLVFPLPKNQSELIWVGTIRTGHA